MSSIWNLSAEKPSFQSLEEDIKTDVLIIGGGMAGLLCGHRLQEAGVDCVICEANEICSGITQNTTAKITYHHGAIFDKMLRRFGPETTGLYVQANRVALDQYDKLCANMDCDFQRVNSYVYALMDREKIEAEARALEAIGCPASFRKNTGLPFSVAGAVEVPDQAQFNPLKFAYAIAKELPIYEHTRVLEVTPTGAKTAKGTIRAKSVLVATHFPFINKYGGYFLKMFQHRSYVIALQNAGDVNGIYVEEAEDGLSFRNYGDLLLMGGGGHRTGKQGGGWQELREMAEGYYPKATEVCHWATQDCKTLDDMPYIGPYSPRTPHLYVATGFNKWGMSSAMVSAMVLTDMVLGKENPYTTLFSPARNILRPQLAINALETAKSLLTPTVPRCPHLGCALKYNPQEHSWDCTCHGSRFAEDGALLNNPATGDLKIDGREK